MKIKINRKQVHRFLIFILINLILISMGDRLIGWLFQAPLIGPGIYQKRFIRLRKFAPNQNDYIRPPDKYISKKDGLIQKDFRFRTDELGFIMPTRKHENPDLTLFFMGGSTTACMYVEEKNRFPNVVGALIEQETGLKVNSYNGGVDGNNSLHSLNILINEILRLDPDVVVFNHNWNDLITLLYTGTYWNDNRHRSPIVENRIVYDEPPTPVSLARDLFRYLTPHLHYQAKHFYHRVRSKFLIQQVHIDEWADIRGRQLKYSKQLMLSEFEKMLRMFIAICRIYDTVPVLVTQQNRIDQPPDEFIQMVMKQMKDDFGIKYNEFRLVYEAFNESIRTVAQRENVFLIDLDREIPKSREFIYDTVHFNDKGSILAAGIIAGKLIDFFDSNKLSAQTVR
jgi:hypothetical protein